MLARENSGFSVDASVRITLFRLQLRVYCQPLEHLLRYCGRPPFAIGRLSVIRGPDGRVAKVRYVLPRHKAANWIGRGRGRKSTRPGPTVSSNSRHPKLLDRLADLVPPPRKHRHQYHGVFAPNHKLRSAVTALAIGNIGKQREAMNGGHGNDGRATGGFCDANPNQKPRSHDTSRIAWAKLMARGGEEFPLVCPACGGGDIRLIAFITEPGPIRKSSPTSANRSRPRQCRPPGGRPLTGPNPCKSTTTGTSCRPHPTSCPRSTSTASDRCQTPGHDKAARPPDSERLRADARKTPLQGGRNALWKPPSET
jgi:hypothetical protein